MTNLRRRTMIVPLAIALVTACSASSEPMGGASGGSSGESGGAGGGTGGTPGGSGGAGGTMAGNGTGGTVGANGTGGTAGASGTGGASGAGGALAHFSFFATSLKAMRMLSGNENGFGGDLHYGQANGLAGADMICSDIAEMSMPGSSAKQWRAFLSTVSNPSQVNAKDRIGTGPWYDRTGRLIASTLTALLMQRPGDASAAIRNDLPNENGIANHNPDGTGQVDNHDFLTGTGTDGNLYKPSSGGMGPTRAGSLTATCYDWTSNMQAANMGPWCGHSWGAQSGQDWKSSLAEGGCGAGVNLIEMGGPQRGVYTVGTGGGYGGIYCFALTP
ncbi:MAG TPA: hypothetical protein VH374_10105 [Polyangia bacterium]|nr:hypothetical protein [Polyangia bacterium]